TEITSNSITLNWTSPADDLSSYDLRYSYLPIDRNNFEASPELFQTIIPKPEGIERFTVNCLLSNTTYYFALTSKDASGNISQISNLISAETTGGIPWQTSKGNYQRTGQSPYKGLSEPKEAWKLPAAYSYNFSMAIAQDGTIYFPGKTELYAINPTGSITWRYLIPESSKLCYSAPSIAPNGTIYIGDSYEACNLNAINPDGTGTWRSRLNAFIFSSPAIDSEGNIYVGTFVGKFYSLTPEGRLRWEYNVYGNDYTSPAISQEGVVYVAFNYGKGRVRAFYLDGRLKWLYDLPQHTFSSPGLDLYRNLYIGCEDGILYCLREDGTLRGTFSTQDKIKSSPALDKAGNIYFGSDDKNLYCLKPDLSLKWSYPTVGKVRSSPIIDPDGCIYFLSDDGYLYCLRSDGTLRWSYKLSDAREDLSSFSPCMDRFGRIYAVGWKGTNYYLYCLDAGTPTYYSLTGYIKKGDKAPIEGVKVVLSGCFSATCTTKADGYYEFFLSPGTYTLNTSHPSYTFTPKSAQITIKDTNLTQSFTATGISCITLKKTCDKKYIAKGGTLTYTITYTNEGEGTVTDVSIIEVLPEHCVLKGMRDEGLGIRYWYNEGWQIDLSESATKIKWAIPEVAPGEMGTVSFTCEVR
ncbi:MAG: PQQ-binding-like beta-propeller repeat protein, partial [bacterium]